LLTESDEELYRRAGSGCGVILLTPERIERGTGYQAMVLDTSPAAALARARRLEALMTQLMSAAPAARSA
jgi:hypothetical protein